MLTKKLSKFLKFLLLNIHTILLFVGITFIVVAAFLFNQIIGFLVLGISLIAVSLIINKNYD
ncbi:MAG: hypothetical protein WBA84_09945 [Carnobacterium sp.]|uniref:hypothetical protein n=1 Tax=Carnobacterium sp. TaxID=48221 RepID=UPI003C72DD07